MLSHVIEAGDLVESKVVRSNKQDIANPIKAADVNLKSQAKISNNSHTSKKTVSFTNKVTEQTFL